MNGHSRLAMVLSALVFVAMTSCRTRSDATDAKVTGGENVLTSMHPAADAIARATVFIKGPAGKCSGTLVSKRLVVTAAHCVVVPAYPPPLLSVYELYFPAFGSQSLEVSATSDVVMNIDYPGVGVNVEDGKLPFNDIGLIRLSDDAPSEYRPALVIKSDATLSELQVDQGKIKSRGQKALIAGFGRLQAESAATDFQMAELELYLADEAGGRLGFAADGSAACKGDSGGPVFTYDGEQLILIGISSSATCDRTWDINVNGTQQNMTIFVTWATDIRRFTPWLLDQLTPTEQATLRYSKVTYEAASSARPDAVSMGVLGYMKESLNTQQEG